MSNLSIYDLIIGFDPISNKDDVSLRDIIINLNQRIVDLEHKVYLLENEDDKAFSDWDNTKKELI